MRRLQFFLILILSSCASAPPASYLAAKLDRVTVSKTEASFQTAHGPFHPWGMNYGNQGRLIEDFWDTEWRTVADDFREMKAAGANVVRLHLQFGKFMTSAQTPNTNALRQLRRTLKLAEDCHIYLDLTGLACYRASENPPWYDALEESARWQAQSKFWEIIAETCAASPAVFCYDLINEPLSPADKRQQYRSGSQFGGFDFLQYIALDPKGRKREDIAAQWIREMTSAIRKHDTNALITVGLLPWSRDWKHLSGFIPEKVAPELDFISVHIYPDSKKLGEAMEGLEKFAIGKPVVIEETFPLSCSPAELETFMRDSRKYATGWVGHYDGQSIKELNALEAAHKLTTAQSIYREWLKLFVRLKPEFAGSDR